MYSPKISEDLVRTLYYAAKDRKMPMTLLVDKIIRVAILSNSLPQGKLIGNRFSGNMDTCHMKPT